MSEDGSAVEIGEESRKGTKYFLIQL